MKNAYIDHIAIETNNIKDSVEWYMSQFKCDLKYQDQSWAMLKFDNISVALVTPGEHPPHFAVVKKSIRSDKNLKKHRDGIGFKYVQDPDKNFIEFIDKRS
tara:strand:+ start:1261 stop:1563 length:303 start_codon:yes stop_codon:yes gene_type:complete